jgi:hypothetical protein
VHIMQLDMLPRDFIMPKEYAAGLLVGRVVVWIPLYRELAPKPAKARDRDLFIL